MPDERMPKEKNLGPRPLLGLPSPALLIAEGEAALKAKAPRLRAQQVRVATRKKGRLRTALRHLWDKKRPFKAFINGIEIGGPSSGPHHPSEIDPAPQTWGPPRKGEPADPMLRVSPEKEAR